MIRIAWIINCVVMLLTISTCDAFVEGWIWNTYLSGSHCFGIPVPQESFNHLGIPWERYTVNKSDWKVGDFSGFEICLPQQGMRIFRSFTFRAQQREPHRFNDEKDYDISFFVLGLYDGCTWEQVYSSGTLWIWSSRQFEYKHGGGANKEFMEKLASEFMDSNNNVHLECWPQPNIEASLFVNTAEMAFKLLVHKNGTVYQLSTFMPNDEHRNFFIESFQLH